jgi:hypothetical protein
MATLHPHCLPLHRVAQHVGWAISQAPFHHQAEQETQFIKPKGFSGGTQSDAHKLSWTMWYPPGMKAASSPEWIVGTPLWCMWGRWGRQCGLSGWWAGTGIRWYFHGGICSPSLQPGTS